MHTESDASASKRCASEGVGPPTICHVLFERATIEPDRVVFDFLDRQQADQSKNAGPIRAEDQPFGVVDGITEAQLLKSAGLLARRLQTVASPGDRIVIGLPPGLDFIVAFFACLLAGMVAVPAPSPRPSRTKSRLTGLMNDCDAKAVLINQSVFGRMSADWQNHDRSIEWLIVEPWRARSDADDDRWLTLVQDRLQSMQAGEIAFLQYTSGSTSEPKGVVVTHENIMRNVDVISHGFDLTSFLNFKGSRHCTFWLPPYHDMGLVGAIIVPFCNRWQTSLMSPSSFLQRPARWLQALSDAKSMITGAPNFAFDYCVEKVTDAQLESIDLSSLRLLFCGAEPVRARSLRRFAERFGTVGFQWNTFYPCYGMAESTLMATGPEGANKLKSIFVDQAQLANHKIEIVEKDDGDAGRSVQAPRSMQTPRSMEAPRSMELVSCGLPHKSHHVIVVNPTTGELCGERELGEVWLSGKSIAAGYWNRAQESKQTFAAVLSSTDSSPSSKPPVNAENNGNATRRWLRTGDQGFLHERELYLTGRIKDLILIRGQNHYPQDIENTVGDASSTLPVNASAAFGVDNGSEENLVIVQELDRHHRGRDQQAVLQDIRRSVTERHDIEPSVILLIRPSSLPRTSSGKVQRNQTRELYSADALKVVAQWERPQSEPTADSELLEVSGEGEFEKVALEKITQMSADEKTETIEAFLLHWMRSRDRDSAKPISGKTPFADSGLDSVTAVEMSFELEKWLDFTIDPDAAWSHTSPREMAEYLAGEVSQSSSANDQADD